MNRRSLLALSAIFLAGCGQSPSTGTSTTTGTESPTETATGTDTSTKTNTPTETDTPTETATPELSDREQAAAEALDRAVRELNQAVADYTGSNGESLLDVSAGSNPVPRVSVLGELRDAREDIQEARENASGRQQPRIEAIEEARQFISLCLDTQTRLIAAYEELVRAREAVDNEAAGTIGAAVTEIRDERGRAERTFTTIQEETSADTVSVVPAIPTDDYEGKVAQFTAELDGFASLIDFLDRLREATVDLNDAERFDRVENENRARDRAGEAAEAFEALTTELREFASNLPEAGSSLVSVSNDLADIAETKAEKAREIQEENS
jgi:hypothetical protein